MRRDSPSRAVGLPSAFGAYGVSMHRRATTEPLWAAPRPTACSPPTRHPRVAPRAAVCLSAALVIAAAASGVGAAEPRTAILSGEISGTSVASRTIPDTGSSYALSGSGRLNVGRVTVTGSLRGTGFIVRGTCSGTVLLAGRAGTLSLRLRSPSPVPGFSTCSAYGWEITGSTGSFAGQAGHGVVTATVGGGAFTLRFG
jgi:hypothetical protein